MSLCLARWFATALLPAAAIGCTTTVAATPPVVVGGDGAVTLDWTIDEAKDPNLCAQSNATSILVDVYAAAGGSAGTFEQSCEAFATSIRLPAGDYEATAVLIDGAGNARTTSIAINPFRIHGGDTLTIPIDFPASSFH